MLWAPKAMNVFFRLQFLPTHINPEWHKLCGESSSGASSQMLGKPSHPAAKSSLSSAGLVAGSLVPIRHGHPASPMSHTQALEVHMLSSPPLLGSKHAQGCGIPRCLGWATCLKLNNLKMCGWSKLPQQWGRKSTSTRHAFPKALAPKALAPFWLGWSVFCRSWSLFIDYRKCTN